MKTILALLVVLFGIVCPLRAGPIVSITQRLPDGDKHGSGTIIGKGRSGEYIVLTCGHGWIKDAGSWIVDSEEETIYKARVLKIDSRTDLGLLAIPRDAEIQGVIPVASDEPAKNDTIHFAGYVKNGTRLIVEECRVKEHNRDALKVSEAFIQGQSGGPLIHRQHVVGVISGSYLKPENGARGYGVRLSVIRKFVEPYIAIEESDQP